MVLDSSAILTILMGEPERRAFNEAIESAETNLLSVASFVEISIVIEARHGAEGLRDFDLFIERAGIELISVDVEQGRAARHAYALYGKGRHPAGLNYGDCFAYALARVLAQPLLYKGTDFSLTDVQPFAPGPS